MAEQVTYSSVGPVYLGLGTNMTLKLSALHFRMCINSSNGVEAGFVVYVIWASPKLIDNVVGAKWLPNTSLPCNDTKHNDNQQTQNKH